MAKNSKNDIILLCHYLFTFQYLCLVVWSGQEVV